MGIHGLWPLLEPTSTAITLDALEGKRMAIDVSFWLYQAQQGYSKNGQNTKNPHLLLMLNRIAKLVFYKVRPVFIFDGENIPRFKKQILRDRCLKKHLNEITGSREQKKMFERIAKEQLSSVENSLDGFAEANIQKKAANKLMSSFKTDLDVPSTSNGNIDQIDSSAYSSDSEESSNFDGNKTGIYSSTLDAQISKLEEVKERQRNAKLQPWEIPDDSKQFSQFQLERLVKKNKLSTQLYRLRADKIRNTIELHFPLNGLEKKLIVTDKQRRTHVLTKSEEIQVIERENFAKSDLTWPRFLQVKTDESNFSNKLQQKIANENKNDSNSEGEEDEFIDVSDLEDGDGTGNQHFPEEMTDSNEEMDFIEKTSRKSDEKVDERDESEIEELNDDEGQIEEEEDYFRPKNQSNCNDHIYKRNNETEGIYADCQNLLTFLGLPFMQAPAEAEAQCVELERLNLVDGVVSDDSDVWLFGGKEIFKNMFSRQKDIQKYSAEEIKQKLGLDQSEFIQLGMLAGGDYSRGLEQVGMVAALELVSEFVQTDEENNLERAIKSLKSINKWILSKKDTQNGNFIESARRIRLRKIIEANNSEELIKLFPNEDVFRAYANPLVDSSAQRFRWKRVDFAELEKFLDDKIGLPKQQIDKMTHGAFQRWDEFMAKQTQTYQPRITDFTRQLDEFGGILGASRSLAPTDRVQRALEKLKKKNSKEMDGKEEDRGSKIKSQKITTSTIGGKNKKRKWGKGRQPAAKKTKTTSAQSQQFTLSEESSGLADD